MGKPAAVNEQPERKNTNSVFMKVRPNIKLEFFHKDATALSHSDYAIGCLDRNWFLYVFIGFLFSLGQAIRVNQVGTSAAIDDVAPRVCTIAWRRS